MHIAQLFRILTLDRQIMKLLFQILTMHRHYITQHFQILTLDRQIMKLLFKILTTHSQNMKLRSNQKAQHSQIIKQH